MAFMTPDQIAAAEKKAQDDRLMAKKQQEDAILAKRLLEEKQASSPEAKAQREAENREDMHLLLLPLEMAGGMFMLNEFAGAETTQGDPNDPNGGNMITKMGNEISSLLGMGTGPQPTGPGIQPPKQNFSFT
jgi:hypothetical protein